MNPKALCQLELHSTRIEATLDFLEKVFDWKAIPITLHEYVVLEVPADCPYGISVVATASEGQQGIVPYFRREEDLETLLQTSSEHGGRLVWGPRRVPGYGELYLIEIPGAIQLGFFRPLSG